MSSLGPLFGCALFFLLLLVGGGVAQNRGERPQPSAQERDKPGQQPIPGSNGASLDMLKAALTATPRDDANYTYLLHLIQNLTASFETFKRQGEDALNVSWGLMTGFLIFFMQAGFGMLEAGVVRKQYVKEILLKKLLGLAVSAMVWWWTGYALAYGTQKPNESPVVGTTNYFGEKGPDYQSEVWMFHFAFASNCASIVSGALADRATLLAYLLVNFFITGFLHPLLAHWIWSLSGWMSPYSPDHNFLGTVGFLDMAGGAAVHGVGGFAGLVGVLMAGRRRAVTDTHLEPADISLQSLGVFILWFGWYGFNTGSVKNIARSYASAERVAFNMTISCAAAAITGYFVNLLIMIYYKRKMRKFAGNFDEDRHRRELGVTEILNSILAGLVGITGTVAYIDYWAACIVGFISFLVYRATKQLMRWHRIRPYVDDPLDTFAVHGMCGIWGIVAAGLWGRKSYIDDVYLDTAPSKYYGLFMGGGWNQLGVQLIGLAIIIVCTVASMACVFALLRLLRLLRKDNPELSERNLQDADDIRHMSSFF